MAQAKLDPLLAEQYVSRWDAVEKVQREEHKNLSIDRCLKKLDSLLRMAIGLELPIFERNQNEIAQVRQRWIELKEKLT